MSLLPQGTFSSPGKCFFKLADDTGGSGGTGATGATGATGIAGNNSGTGATGMTGDDLNLMHVLTHKASNYQTLKAYMKQS